MKLLIRLVTVTAVSVLIALGGLVSVASATPQAKTPKIKVTVTPNPLVETGASEVHAVVQVETVAGLAGAYVNISSIQLTNSCAADEVSFTSIAGGTEDPVVSDPIRVQLDNEGNATVLLDAYDCAPGKDVVEADVVSAPYWSAKTTLVVKPPADSAHGVTAYPSTEVETGTSGEGGNSDVYAVFEVETKSVYAERTVEIQADELVDRCGQGSYWVSNGGTFSGSTATATLDDNGNAVFDFFGASCATGRSTIIADVEAGLHPTYTTYFKILSPRPTF
jgi:hypothetical protein